MKKLIKGIVDFRRNTQEEYRKLFSELAIRQTPDALFIACSDSRVVPNTFASTNPGDLFVLRNVGNLIPPCGNDGIAIGDKSEAAAIEYAVSTLEVSDIIICGHSECGAMRALLDDRNKLDSPNLKRWLRNGDGALQLLSQGVVLNPGLSPHNQLSQLNVLLQMANIKSYPSVRERLAEGRLSVHGWWFDLAKADVYHYEKDLNRFVLIDETEAQKMLEENDPKEKLSQNETSCFI